MRVRSILVVISILVFLASGAYADGFFAMKQDPKLDPRSYAGDITEPVQKAFILYGNGVERLILQVSYKGSVSEFAWLVPTPSKPEVTKVSVPIFHQLHSATAPKIRYWFDADKKLDVGYMSLKAVAAAPAPGGLDVQVIEEKTIGAYDIAVLKAGNGNDLLTWLRQNSYRIDPKLSPVLADYIRRGWIFTAMRVNIKAQAKSKNRLHEGVLQSLSFKFRAAEPIYPLKISSLNKGKTDILLYIAAAHRVDNPMMQTECVLSSREIMDSYMFAGPIVYINLNVTNRLTKLTATLTSDQMTHDLVMKPAASDATVSVKDIPPPFLKNLGASTLLMLDKLLPYPKSMFVLGFTGLIALSPLGRKRWRIWLAVGIAFIMIGVLGDSGQYMHWLLPEDRNEDNFQKAGIIALVFIGAVVAGISLSVVRGIRRVKKN